MKGIERFFAVWHAGIFIHKAAAGRRYVPTIDSVEDVDDVDDVDE